MKYYSNRASRIIRSQSLLIFHKKNVAYHRILSYDVFIRKENSICKL